MLNLTRGPSRPLRRDARSTRAAKARIFQRRRRAGPQPRRCARARDGGCAAARRSPSASACPRRRLRRAARWMRSSRRAVRDRWPSAALPIPACTTRPMRWPRCALARPSACRAMRSLRDGARVRSRAAASRCRWSPRRDGVRLVRRLQGHQRRRDDRRAARLRQPAVLIAGGDGKGQDFSPLRAPVARARARRAC